MEPEDLERLRRSVAMLPEGHKAGALTKEMADKLLEEVAHCRQETDRYRAVVAQLRALIEALPP